MLERHCDICGAKMNSPSSAIHVRNIKAMLCITCCGSDYDEHDLEFNTLDVCTACTKAIQKTLDARKEEGNYNDKV